MRIIVLPALVLSILLAACSREAPPTPSPAIAPGLFAGSGRDALCIAGAGKAQHAGFIAYGAGDSNCSASGTLAQAGGKWVLRPSGDSECRIPLTLTKDGIVLGGAAPSCAYYCAPGATFAGKSFVRTAHPGANATDFGGDPLC